jgi:CheY-like chemotaxis protein
VIKISEAMSRALADPCRGTHARGRILIVEDDRALRLIFERALTPDFEVIAVCNGREALDRLGRDDRFALILCDLGMPQMGGAALQGELERRRPELAERMVFLTGGATSEDDRRFLIGRRWLKKPITPSALLSSVHSLVS